MTDIHDKRTPPTVFTRANTLAVQFFGRPLSFDRQASHLNAMPPPGMGPQLPFNSMFWQPGTRGVDMFLQPRQSWVDHVNFIHPAAPTVSRTLSFVRVHEARAVIVVPAPDTLTAWWAPELLLGSPGVSHYEVFEGFALSVFWAVRRYPISSLHDTPTGVCV